MNNTGTTPSVAATENVDVDELRGSAFQASWYKKLHPKTSQFLMIRLWFFILYPKFWSRHYSFGRWITFSILYLTYVSTLAFKILQLPLECKGTCSSIDSGPCTGCGKDEGIALWQTDEKKGEAWDFVECVSRLSLVEALHPLIIHAIFTWVFVRLNAPRFVKEEDKTQKRRETVDPQKTEPRGVFGPESLNYENFEASELENQGLTNSTSNQRMTHSSSFTYDKNGHFDSVKELTEALDFHGGASPTIINRNSPQKSATSRSRSNSASESGAGSRPVSTEFEKSKPKFLKLSNLSRSKGKLDTTGNGDGTPFSSEISQMQGSDSEDSDDEEDNVNTAVHENLEQPIAMKQKIYQSQEREEYNDLTTGTHECDHELSENTISGRSITVLIYDEQRQEVITKNMNLTEMAHLIMNRISARMNNERQPSNLFSILLGLVVAIIPMACRLLYHSVHPGTTEHTYIRYDIQPEAHNFMGDHFCSADFFSKECLWWSSLATAWWTLLKEGSYNLAGMLSLYWRRLAGNSPFNFIGVLSCFLASWMSSSALILEFNLADWAYEGRLLGAKYFSALTSWRKAQRCSVPHFKLQKVEFIRFWLSLRSLLRRRSSGRAVDLVVSSSFILTLVSVVLMMYLQVRRSTLEESASPVENLVYWLVLFWGLVFCTQLLRFITVGAKINRKYQNTAILLVEQMNIFFRMENQEGKSEDLVLANNVLKVASKLLREFEQPNKISGISMSPWMYHVTRVVVLSAFSAVVSDMLGFKLKLWKVKL